MRFSKKCQLFFWVFFWFFTEKQSDLSNSPCPGRWHFQVSPRTDRRAAHSGAAVYTHMAPDLQEFIATFPKTLKDLCNTDSLQLPNLPYWTGTHNVHSRDLITWKLGSVFCSKELLKTVWKCLRMGLFISFFCPGTNCLTFVVFGFCGFEIVLTLIVTLEILRMKISGLPCGNALLHQSCCFSSKPSRPHRRFLWVGDIT